MTRSSPQFPWRHLLFAFVLTLPLVASAPVDAAQATASPMTAWSTSRSAADWLWPIDGPHAVERAFQAPTSPWGPGHRGIDLSAHEHLVVRAPADGRVTFAGVVVNRPVITLDHGSDVLSSYEAVRPLVDEGDAVQAGDPIGAVTTGPHCQSTCVHVGVRVNGRYVNPLLYFGELERAVLLPLG